MKRIRRSRKINGPCEGEVRSYELELTITFDLKERSADEPLELDPDEAITKIYGRIMCWMGEAGASTQVGYLEAMLVDLGNCSNSYETFDNHSSELEGLHRHLFGRYAGVMRPYAGLLYDPDGVEDMWSTGVAGWGFWR